MRTRITIQGFEPNTRSIDSGIEDLTIEDIRLIINETQKVVICSSMQKDNVVLITNGTVTYDESLPVLNTNDQITFEIDICDTIEDAIQQYDENIAAQLRTIIGD